MTEKQECPVCHHMFSDARRHGMRMHWEWAANDYAYRLRLQKARWHKNIKEEAANLTAERAEEKSLVKSDRAQRKKVLRELVQTIQEVKT